MSKNLVNFALNSTSKASEAEELIVGQLRAAEGLNHEFFFTFCQNRPHNLIEKSEKKIRVTIPKTSCKMYVSDGKSSD